MKRIITQAAVLSVLGLAGHIGAASLQIGAHHFTVPEGFTIELVAGTNLAQRPVSAGFDDKGRLYVTDSSGSNEKPSEQLKNPTHRVLRLEDTDGDGKFDRSVVFADKVMFPQGCLWHDGSVYVAGPPSIWKFTDTDGDGVADKREEWFKGGTLTGCANDIHGPHLGPDGYLYWTKGAFDEQTHTLGNGRILKDRAAHIFRAKPDGTDLDVVMTGGMDNPVEVAFTAEGEVVFTSTFIDFTQPGRRDGIGHASYGAVFGKVNSALEDGRVKRAGPELSRPFVQFGAGAPSGLCRYESSSFGEAYRDNLFATLFNLRKVTRHILRRDGATYAGTDSDFVVSDNMDFHPTDVLPAPDGSLIIVDTGGWYKLCCPSSQLAKADVFGGIYRVKRTGTGLVEASLISANAGLDQRVLALKQIALRRDATKAAGVRRRLDGFGAISEVSAAQALVCAEALGKMADRASVPSLLNLAERAGGDETLVQAAIFALIEIADAPQTRSGLESRSPGSLRAALIALDQMDDGGLKAEDVLPHFKSGDASLRQAASWIAGRHPDWAGALVGYFRGCLATKDLPPAEQTELQGQLAQFAKDRGVQELIAGTARNSTASAAARATALRAMSRAGLKESPTAWYDAVTAALSEKDNFVLLSAVVAARQLPPPKTGVKKFSEALQKVGRSANISAADRLAALAAVPGGLNEVDSELFNFVLANLVPTTGVAERSAAANVVSKAKLTEPQLTTLAGVLKDIGPLEIPKLLPAFERAPSEALGLQLLASLKASKGASALRPEVLRPRLTNFPAVVQQKAGEFLASLNQDASKQKTRLEYLLSEVHGKGDVRRGQAIFNSAKAACLACHAIGYQGGKVGPDLTRISEVRSERDLLEAIVYPSASFVRSYEPMIVATKDGEEQSGVLRKDTPDEVLLATGPTTEVRIARSEISEMRPGTVSVMPQGLDEQLNHQELADLIAFLRNTKWGAQ